jgi:hypothetical protein
MTDRKTPARTGTFAMDGSINKKPPTSARPEPPKAQIAMPKALAAQPLVAPPKKSKG